MKNEKVESQLLILLNQAVARELQVSIQYMLQHAIAAGRGLAGTDPLSSSKQSKFVASHSLYFLPGVTLKKIAITEMRHAEAISERITLLGGIPTTQAGSIVMDKTIKGMLENDQEKERGAIELYRKIITLSGQEHDTLTMNLFKNILSDEQKHLNTFSALLE